MCSYGSFTDFSTSFTFTTTGEATNNGGNTTSGGTADNDSENTSEETTDDNQNFEGTNCQTIEASDLTTSSITDTYAYIYTPQPFGAVNNQFRYRIVGTETWTETEISVVYYNFLSNLASGTTYEFQVRHECTVGDWSNYSSSAEFTTTGESADGGSGDAEEEIVEEEIPTDNGEENTDAAAACDNPVSGESIYTLSLIHI